MYWLYAFLSRTGPFEDDPNLTDKRFPGNPTSSYRTREPLRVVGEVLNWEGHSPEVLQDMRDCWSTAAAPAPVTHQPHRRAWFHQRQIRRFE